MKIRTLKFCIYCIFICIHSTAQFSDSFDDGDFRSNPPWIGDTVHFEINGGFQLHLNAPAVTGKSYLVTPSGVSSGAVWKFRVQTDFNPSSTNFAKVYLMSDKARIDSALNGYYLRIGGTDDDISLFRQDGLTSKLIIDGRNGMLNASVNKLSVLVTRSFGGEWQVSCDSSGQDKLVPLGTVTDTIYRTSHYFGLQCIYTSTRSNKFLFDDFEVSGKHSADTIPPVVRELVATDDSLVMIRFSEDVDVNNAPNVANIQLPAGVFLKKIWLADGRTLMLHLSTSIPCRQKLEITVAVISDMAGNVIIPSTSYISFCPGNAHDILITEIMADPDPPVMLPNVEYLELSNKSGVNLDLEKWLLQVGSSKVVFPSFILPADSLLVVCSSKGCSQFKTSGLCLDLLSTGTLNNTGEYVGLRNKKGKLIHWVNYDETFYGDDLKKSGGWSMEMIDVAQPCLAVENWKASTDLRGGTPGIVNAVSGAVTDARVFQLQHVFLPGDSSIRLYFSKSLDVALLNNSLFTLDQGFGSPVGITADSLKNRYVDLVFLNKFMPAVSYRLDITNDISACAGNKLSGVSVVFMKPEVPAPGDMIINEILFDVLPGGQEFIEFYNNSDKYICSSDLKFACRTPAATYGATVNLGEYPFLIPPHCFAVVAKSAEELVKLHSIPDNRFVLSCKNFPTLSNDEGCIALMNKSLETLDELCYSEKMHFSLLVNKAGVSLERMRYNQPTSDIANWHSASFGEGYATPGVQNSQFQEQVENDTEIVLEHEIFSPDNDGYKDVETIFYQLDKPGFVASILVFDALGRRVTILANNKPLGTKGSFTWDGVDDKGRLAQTGIYLIYIELHHTSGEVKRYKKTCVLGGEMRR